MSEETAGTLVQELKEETVLPLFRFIVHTVTGVGLFLLLCLPAFGLMKAVEYLEAHGMTGARLIPLEIAEWTVLVLDVLLFVVFMFRASWKWVKAIW